jgi:hypothetical protein
MIIVLPPEGPVPFMEAPFTRRSVADQSSWRCGGSQIFGQTWSI